MVLARVCSCSTKSSHLFKLLKRIDKSSVIPSSWSALNIPSRTCFYRYSEKGNYLKKDETSNMAHFKNGLKILKDEIKVWKDEVIETFECDPRIYYPGDLDVFWKFNEPELLNTWVVTTDKDNEEGFSSAQLGIGKNNTAVFSGVLDPRVPKDGKLRRSGYCNMRSIRPTKSFKRNDYHDWTAYTHLIMKVRGDGRSYMIGLGCRGDFDIQWLIIYNFILFTRGGPYWQTAKIPFSKFFLSNRGRIQDKQLPVPLDRITNFGITCADKIPGPFNLEIDFIGGYIDPGHTERFAYEMYETPRNYVPGL